MARNKEEQARMEGMAQALRIAKEKGCLRLGSGSEDAEYHRSSLCSQPISYG